jgi:hypothetical protein
VSIRKLTAVAALAAAAAAVVVVVRRDRRLHAQLARERAAYRLTDACLHRDLEVFQCRIDLALARAAVVDEAGLVLDDALTRIPRIDPYPEGGPT